MAKLLDSTSRTFLVAIPLTGLIILSSILGSTSAWSETTNLGSTCSVSMQNYMTMLDVYQNSPKKNGNTYRSLVVAHKEATRERKECIKSIDSIFKNEIKAIKSKFDAMKSDPRLKREVLEAQRRSEITSASLRRDEAIRNLIPISEIPARPKPKK